MVERGRSTADAGGRPHVVVFGPSPLLEVSIEPGGNDPVPPRIRVLPGGQAVWVARMAATMGSAVTMCGLVGGEVGELLRPMLAREPFDLRLVETDETGCFVVDQRHEPATEVASDWAGPPRTAALDDLVATTLDAAAAADMLVVGNPMPGEALPLHTYTRLVAGATDAGVPVLVDLSTPRLEAALAGGPAAVKLNDWELAELVRAPVDEPSARSAALHRLIDLGAHRVVETRGPATVVAVDGDETVELRPPVVGDGRAAGCGDAMVGAMAAVLAEGSTWLDAVRLGMGAGAAHYRGRGESSRSAIEALAEQVVAHPIPM
jgi:fructose-1-phosphate kinase PfkB-like protein